MTRRTFFSRSLACLAAMVLAPVRAVEPRVPLIGNWDGKVRLIGTWRGRTVMSGLIADPKALYFADGKIWGIQAWLIPPAADSGDTANVTHAR